MGRPLQGRELFSKWHLLGLANLDGTLHALRVNGLRLKIYHARLMVKMKDEAMEEAIMPAKEVTFFYEEGVQMLFFE